MCNGIDDGYSDGTEKTITVYKGMTPGMTETRQDECEIVTAKCSECGSVKRMAFKKGKRLRCTYCMNCQMAVIWEKVSPETKTEGQKLVEFCDRMMEVE